MVHSAYRCSRENTWVLALLGLRPYRIELDIHVHLAGALSRRPIYFREAWEFRDRPSAATPGLYMGDAGNFTIVGIVIAMGWNDAPRGTASDCPAFCGFYMGIDRTSGSRLLLRTWIHRVKYTNGAGPASLEI